MNLLFVADNPSDVSSYISLLKDKGINVAIVEKAKQAALAIKNKNISMVVAVIPTDGGAPLKLLEAIKKHQGQIFRIALNRMPAQQSVIQASVLAAHHQFSLEGNEAALLPLLDYFGETHKVLDKKVVTQAVQGVKTLPTPPKIFLQLNALMKSAGADSQKAADIITQDPALTAKVLQVANQSFLPGNKAITTITDAITRIGMETLSCIVMTAELFDDKIKVEGFDPVSEQKSALALGRFSSEISHGQYKGKSLLTGLLQSLGKSVLYSIDKAITQKYLADTANFESILDKQNRYFGTNQAKISGYLLHLWGFPADIVAAILLQDSPAKLLKDSFDHGAACYCASSIKRGELPNGQFISHYNLGESMELLNNDWQKFAPNKI